MDAAVTRYLGHLALRGFSAETIRSRRNTLARMSVTLGCPLIEATAGDLLIWRRLLRTGPAATANYVSAAAGFYAWAVDEDLLDASPATRLPCPKVGRRLPRPISDADLMAALDSAPDRIRPWLVLAGWCGLRAKEIALLRVGCIMTTARPRPLLLVAGDATKGTSERTVPLCRFVIGELSAAGLPGSGYAFRRLDGQPGPNRPWLVSGLANEYLHEHGITATMHQLRHRFGTRFYETSGHDLLATSATMGHKRPESTAGYADWSRAGAAEAAEALPVPRRPGKKGS